jgi:uncharacterized protein (TIGR03435 family)
MMAKASFLGAVGIVAVGAMAGVPVAQVPSTPAFETASIKPSGAGGRGTTMGMQPGRYTATNVTLRALILNAYSLESFQLSGGPSWTSSDHFDIVAKISAGASGAPDLAQSQLMLRELLADRFKLAMHTESRELPIYALVAARSDKKLGPQNHPTTIDCEPLAAQSTLKEKDGKDKSKRATRRRVGGAAGTRAEAALRDNDGTGKDVGRRDDDGGDSQQPFRLGAEDCARSHGYLRRFQCEADVDARSDAASRWQRVENQGGQDRSQWSAHFHGPPEAIRVGLPTGQLT